MDELIYIKDTDVIGLTVTMKADRMNESHQIDIFSPSLLTLGTANKIFIIDILKLGQWVELDDKLCDIIRCSPGVLTCFGVPTFI